MTWSHVAATPRTSCSRAIRAWCCRRRTRTHRSRPRTRQRRWREPPRHEATSRGALGATADAEAGGGSRSREAARDRATDANVVERPVEYGARATRGVCAMRFFAFHLMPYTELDPSYDGPAWVTCPNTLYDPRVGNQLYNRYLDELLLAEELGFDGVCVNEH